MTKKTYLLTGTVVSTAAAFVDVLEAPELVLKPALFCFPCPLLSPTGKVGVGVPRVKVVEFVG
jgi:hypothetical protein